MMERLSAIKVHYIVAGIHVLSWPCQQNSYDIYIKLDTTQCTDVNYSFVDI